MNSKGLEFRSSGWEMRHSINSALGTLYLVLGTWYNLPITSQAPDSESL